MVRHHKALAWEATLKDVFDEIDHDLEARFGHRYPLHPARPAHGDTANPAESGLFNVGAAFTAGFGSKHGRGYVVQVRMSTLANVSKQVREELEEEVARQLRERLPEVFPGKTLYVERDKTGFKIHGDLSLGNV